MWILARVVVFLLGPAARLVSVVFRPRQHGVIDGVASYLRKWSVGKRTGLELGLALEGPVVFSMTTEDDADRQFKRLGLCDEIQTGDSEFDPKIFIACDHPFLAELLGESATARRAILNVFDKGFNRIWTDGRILWIRSLEHEAESDEFWELLAGLRESMRDLESRLPRRFRDPFVWKALFIEGLTWSIGWYAIAAVVEHLAVKEDYHLEPGAVVRAGLVMSAALLGMFLLVTRLVLRRSSRRHKLVFESALILLLALPIAGPQLVSDLNRSLDRAAPTYETRTIARAEIREHRTRSGNFYRTYHLHLVPTGRPPDEIAVARAVFERAGPMKGLVITWGGGWLGLPWYRELTIAGAR